MNDAGVRRGKEKERATKEKMDEIHEVTGMKLRDATMERKQRRRLVTAVDRVPRTDSTRLQGIQVAIDVHISVQTVFFGAVAMIAIRMKYFWTPYMCVLASVGLADHSAWCWILSRLTSPSRTMVCVCAIYIYLYKNL